MNLNPTDPQREAGNYQMGHVVIHGIPITIEVPKGGVRSGRRPNGERWERVLQHPYGYIKRTTGADGENVDCFIGPNADCSRAYIVNQMNPEFGFFDEAKVMLGFNNSAEASVAYQSNYEPGWQGNGGLVAMEIDQFKEWLKSGSKYSPAKNMDDYALSHVGTDLPQPPAIFYSDGNTATDAEKKAMNELMSTFTGGIVTDDTVENLFGAAIDAAPKEMEEEDPEAEETPEPPVAEEAPETEEAPEADPKETAEEAPEETEPEEKPEEGSPEEEAAETPEEEAAEQKSPDEDPKDSKEKDPKAAEKMPLPPLDDPNDVEENPEVGKEKEQVKMDSKSPWMTIGGIPVKVFDYTVSDSDVSRACDKFGFTPSASQLMIHANSTGVISSDRQMHQVIAMAKAIQCLKPDTANIKRGNEDILAVADAIRYNSFDSLVGVANTRIFKDATYSWQKSATDNDVMVADAVVRTINGEKVSLFAECDSVIDLFAIDMEPTSDALEYDLVVDSNEDYELLEDSRRTGIIRVRQKAMRTDSVNGNRRLYPRHVVQAAINAARENAEAGAMLSDFLHPPVAESGGEQAYIDRPFEKTARVDDISDVGPDGWVYITRTILPTQKGKIVADKVKNRQPLGISTRFKMKGHFDHLNNMRVHVADKIEIHTWDDVPNPAFESAGRDFEILNDSQLQDLGLPCSVSPKEDTINYSVDFLIRDGVASKLDWVENSRKFENRGEARDFGNAHVDASKDFSGRYCPVNFAVKENVIPSIEQSLSFVVDDKKSYSCLIPQFGNKPWSGWTKLGYSPATDSFTVFFQTSSMLGGTDVSTFESENLVDAQSVVNALASCGVYHQNPKSDNVYRVTFQMEDTRTGASIFHPMTSHVFDAESDAVDFCQKRVNSFPSGPFKPVRFEVYALIDAKKDMKPEMIEESVVEVAPKKEADPDDADKDKDDDSKVGPKPKTEAETKKGLEAAEKEYEKDGVEDGSGDELV